MILGLCDSAKVITMFSLPSLQCSSATLATTTNIHLHSALIGHQNYILVISTSKALTCELISSDCDKVFHTATALSVKINLHTLYHLWQQLMENNLCA